MLKLKYESKPIRGCLSSADRLAISLHFLFFMVDHWKWRTQGDVSSNFTKPALCLWLSSEGSPNKSLPGWRVFENENEEVFFAHDQSIVHELHLIVVLMSLTVSIKLMQNSYLLEGCFVRSNDSCHHAQLFFYWLHGWSELRVCSPNMEFKRKKNLLDEELVKSNILQVISLSVHHHAKGHEFDD